MALHGVQRFAETRATLGLTPSNLRHNRAACSRHCISLIAHTGQGKQLNKASHMNNSKPDMPNMHSSACWNRPQEERLGSGKESHQQAVVAARVGGDELVDLLNRVPQLVVRIRGRQLQLCDEAVHLRAPIWV